MRTFLQAIILYFCATALAQDNVIPFQGQLADQSGQPLTPSSPVTIVFRLYQTPVGGVAIWEEAQPNISVNAGRFSVLLGSRSPLPGYTNFNFTVYLGLTVDDGNPATTDVEMRPRQALVPVISASYAKQAQDADTLGGFDWSALFGVNNPQGNLLGSRIAPGTVTSNQIAPQTVTAGQIAPATITGAQIMPATIASDHIAPASLALSLLAKEVMDQLVPPGTIVSFGGDNVPDGWLLCDGRAVSRTDFARLFAAIGTAWGSEIEEDFRLPDLRGYFLRGASLGQATDPDQNGRTNLYAGGSFGARVGSYQADEFKSHNHVNGQFKYLLQITGNDTVRYLDSTSPDPDIARAAEMLPAGGSETRPKNAYVNFIIKH